MGDPLDRTVQIDVTIEAGDYFRAYLDASRAKIAIACLIVLSFISATAYFFFLIGEQHILLEISPLFFGLPLLAIGGQFLRMHATYRKLFADLSDSERNVHYIFHEQSDGFETVNGKNFGHLSWESVRDVVERSRYIRFVLNPHKSLVIPKRFLLTKSDTILLREIIRLHMGAKARLMND